MPSKKRPGSPLQDASVATVAGAPAASATTDKTKRPKKKSKVDRSGKCSYFAGGAAAPSPHVATLNKLFDSYRDDPKEAPDEIRIEGAQKYLEDIGVSLDSPSLLVFSTLVRSPSLGTITRDGFVDAWSHLNAPNVKQQAQTLSNLTASAGRTPASQVFSPSHLASSGSATSASEPLFRRVYKHTFALALPTDTPNARAVPLEEASEYWRLLLGPKSPGLHWVGKAQSTPWLDWWLGFLEEKWKKAVNRDLWNQTLLFAEKSTADESLSFWSEESAWPGVIDEFVEVAKGRRQAEGMDTS